MLKISETKMMKTTCDLLEIFKAAERVGDFYVPDSGVLLANGQSTSNAVSFDQAKPGRYEVYLKKGPLSKNLLILHEEESHLTLRQDFVCNAGFHLGLYLTDLYQNEEALHLTLEEIEALPFESWDSIYDRYLMADFLDGKDVSFRGSAVRLNAQGDLTGTAQVFFNSEGVFTGCLLRA